MKYLPLFHHFKVIYQFPKHIIFWVKIVANAPVIDLFELKINMFYRWNKASELPPFEKVGPTDKQKVIIDYIRYNKNTRCATSCLHVEFLKQNK